MSHWHFVGFGIVSPRPHRSPPTPQNRKENPAPDLQVGSPLLSFLSPHPTCLPPPIISGAAAALSDPPTHSPPPGIFPIGRSKLGNVAPFCQKLLPIHPFAPRLAHTVTFLGPEISEDVNTPTRPLILVLFFPPCFPLIISPLAVLV